jgi:hypothetical protein
MKRLLNLIREPLVLFFLLGFLLFFLYERTSAYVERNNKRIYVSQARLAMLEESYTKTWNRPPGNDELNALINDFIMDEIFYKEAVAMGLDKTDLTVKRRLRQMMEMMMDDFATIYPSEEQLRVYLAEHPEKFRRDDRISFRQLHFSMEEREEAVQLLSRLQVSESAAEDYAGGLLLLSEYYEQEIKFEVDKAFGPYFTTKLFELETGSWTGPIESPFGWHLVYIFEKLEGEVPDLEDIWDVVEREWSVERKNEIKEEQYRILREQYKIVVEEQ